MAMMTDAARHLHSGITLAAATLLWLTGCAASGIGPEAEMPMGPDAEVYDSFDCRSEPSSWIPNTEEPTADPSIPVPGRVPAGFEATAAIRCSLEFDLAPIGGLGGDVFWQVERLEGDLGSLLAALDELDDAPPPGDLLCTADMELVPALWLEERSGGFLPVHYPRDACGKTKPAVRDALDGLQVVLVERIRLAG